MKIEFIDWLIDLVESLPPACRCTPGDDEDEGQGAGGRASVPTEGAEGAIRCVTVLLAGGLCVWA